MLDNTQVASFLDELVKIAETLHTTPAQLKSVLLPHQQRVVDRMQKQKGLVVAHGLGSGKTFSSIAAGVRLNPDKITVAVPASLKENYRKEISKHVEGDLPVEIESLQRAATRGEIGDSDLLIVDEAHRARNTSSKTFGVLRDSAAAKRMLLTASPIYNKPEDIAPLVNIAAGDEVLPTGTEFEKKYIKKPGEGLYALMPWVSSNPKVVKKKELGGLLNAWVDKHMEQGGDFPDHSEKRIAVPMSKQQTKLHQMAWGELPLMVRMRMKKGLPPSKKDLQEINKFESQARQVSNTLKPFTPEGKDAPITPKLTTAFDNLKKKTESNPKHKALVYSNYLGSLDDYGKMLERDKIPYAKFTGQQKAKERKQIIEDYNAGKLKALLVSSAAGEGLDLKGTRQVQVLEPHWNEEKIRQVVGRAIRQGSHSHLPEKERHVEVEKYETYPKGLLGKKTGVEQWLYDMSEQKDRLNRQVLDLIQSDKK